MKQNLHTHSTYCDGKNTIKEMICSALKKDFDVLGFSGHSSTPFDTSYCMTEDGVLAYLDEVTQAKAMFLNDQEAAKEYFAPFICGARDLRIYVGLEQDLYSEYKVIRRDPGLLNPGKPYGTFDYIIGSVHAFYLSWEEIGERTGSLKGLTEPDDKGVVFSEEGIYIYVDYGDGALSWAKDTIFGGDALALAESYFRDEARVVSETDCDIVGHFDLLLKFNEKMHIFDESAPRYIAARNKALDQIFSDFSLRGMRPIFEVNTGAMAKGYRTVPYPSSDSLHAIKERGGQLLINSDCHKAELLDYGFREAENLVKACGFRKEITGVFGNELEIWK